MNIIKIFFLNQSITKNIDKKIKDKIIVEIPKQKIFGDISFNAPLILGSFLKKPPIVLAKEFKKSILNHCNDFEQVEIVKPGFINFTFKKSIISNFLNSVQNNFGVPNKIKKKKSILNLFLLIRLDHFMLVIVEVQYLVTFYVIF